MSKPSETRSYISRSSTWPRVPTRYPSLNLPRPWHPYLYQRNLCQNTLDPHRKPEKKKKTKYRFNTKWIDGRIHQRNPSHYLRVPSPVPEWDTTRSSVSILAPTFNKLRTTSSHVNFWETVNNDELSGDSSNLCHHSREVPPLPRQWSHFLDMTTSSVSCLRTWPFLQPVLLKLILMV